MFVITDPDNIIIFIAKNYKLVKEGILVDEGLSSNCIICTPNLSITEVDTISDSIKTAKYKYTKEGGFIINSDYKPVLTTEEQLNNLGQQLAQEKLSNIQKDSLINGLGQQVADLKLQVIKLQGGTK